MFQLTQFTKDLEQELGMNIKCEQSVLGIQFGGRALAQHAQGLWFDP